MKKILTHEYRVLVTDGSGAGVQGVVVRFCSDTKFLKAMQRMKRNTLCLRYTEM